MQRLFGTDGIRGEANVEPMTPGTALKIGRAIVEVLSRSTQSPVRIVIGRDTRLSGPMIESALAAGICGGGGEVLLGGVIPTPAVAALVRELEAQAGIVISASHNPYEDNGIKIFSSQGFKLTDEEEDEISDLVKAGKTTSSGPTGEEVGRIKTLRDSLPRYENFCRAAWPLEDDLQGTKLVLDCGNGATYSVAPPIFAGLGAEVEVLNNHPDGININAGCGSQYTEALQEKVIQANADAGLAFDGDGDRLIAVDEKGAVLTGDHAMVICARMLRDMDLLRNNLVVTTVMSNFGFNVALKELGIDQEVTDVGDRYVLERMKEKDAVLGGEASGHMIFLDQHTTGDGIISAIQLLAAMKYYAAPLSDLFRLMDMYPQKLVNVEVRSKPPLEEVPELLAATSEAEQELAGKGRVLIRYSGTQSLCRVMVEAPGQETTDRLCAALVQVVREVLG